MNFVAWVLHCYGIDNQLHHLDDFLFMSFIGAQEGVHGLDRVLEIFLMVGIPVAANKIEGLCKQLVFLGILIGTQTLELYLPAEELAHLQLLVRSWLGK